MDNICINCKSINHKKWITVKDIFDDVHQLDLCNNCGIYFLNPQPTPSQLERAYDDSYYGTGKKKFNYIVENVVEWFRQMNANGIAKYLPNNARVLDIGCGNGSFLLNLGKHGDFELHGTELEGKSLDRAKLNSELHLYIGRLQNDTYPEKYFDAIVLTHVFEHLQNPKETLKIINKISKVGATLQIEIPNIESWQAQLFKEKWLHLDPPRHLNFFPPQILKNKLKELGWEPIYESYFSPLYSPFGVQQSILNHFFKQREILYEHLKGNILFTKKYSSLSIFFQKLFHWVTFPFFLITDTVASAFKKGGTVKLRFQKKEK